MGLILASASCGKGGLFTEEYWDGATTTFDPEEEVITASYSVQLDSISEQLSNISGTAKLDVNETDFTITVKMNDVPQNLYPGKGDVTQQTCSEVMAANPTGPILNTMGEFKQLEYTEFSSREALITQLNQDDPQNGDSVMLRGKSLVLKAYVNNSSVMGTEMVSLVPIACGLITKED